MSTLVATADLHLDAGRFGRVNPLTGANTAWESASTVWSAICDHSVGSGAEALLFAGDAFLNAAPSPEAQERFADGLRVVAGAGIPVVLIPGNHEYLGLPAAHRHPLWRYADIDGVVVSHAPEVIRLASGLQVATLPWPRKGLVVSAEDLAGLHPDEVDALIAGRLAEALESLAADIDPSTPSVLLAHATVGEATLGSDRRGSELTVASLFSEPVLPVDLLADGPWGHVVLGHIHRRQQVGETASGGAISYVGSPERIDWSEEHHDKGASELRVEGTAITETLLPTPARRLCTIEAGGDPDPDALGDLSGAVVRLALPTDAADPAPWRRAVTAAGGTVVATLAPPPAGPDPGEAPVVAEDISPLEGLEQWLAAQDLGDDLAARVRAAAQQLAEEAP